MRRNMDLARAILLELETRPFIRGWHHIEIPGHSPEEISYHVQLLHDAGFINAECNGGLSAPFPEWLPGAITWSGHEFLEASRDPGWWEKAKDVVREKGAPLTLKALEIALGELIKRSLS